MVRESTIHALTHTHTHTHKVDYTLPMVRGLTITRHPSDAYNATDGYTTKIHVYGFITVVLTTDTTPVALSRRLVRHRRI